MEHPLLHRIIVMHAKHGMRGGVERREVKSPDIPTHVSLLDLPPYDPSQDRKRAASGEKDED